MRSIFVVRCYACNLFTLYAFLLFTRFYSLRATGIYSYYASTLSVLLILLHCYFIFAEHILLLLSCFCYRYNLVIFEESR